MKILRLAALLLALPTIACAEKPPEPRFASSASSPGYASRFPEELAAVRKEYFDQEKQVQESTKEFRSYPDALENPNWDTVRAVVQHADEEGRSQAYSAELERTETVRRFFENEKNDIRTKVSGAVQYAAKKKNCEGEFGSSAAVALDKAIEERLEENLHGSSDAHTVIQDNEDALGKANVEELEKQADTISRASYLAHIGAVRTKLRLKGMLEEIEQIEKTLDRTTEDLRAAEKNAADDKRKQELAERREAAAKSKSRIGNERAGARSLADEIEKRIEALQKQYAEALKALLDTIDKRRAAGVSPDS
jgi:hypothetical protein